MGNRQVAQQKAGSGSKSTAPKRNANRGTEPLSDRAAAKAGSCPCGGGCPRCGTSARFQAKLNVSQPGDASEREADQISDEVLRAPPQSDVAARVSSATLSAPEQSISSSANVDSVFRSPGQPLDAAANEFFGSRFGYDFSNVRVHADAPAAESAQSVNARAYTVGDNIAFNAGEYRPGSQSGQRLLAHELTHVVQQSRGAGATLQRQPQEPGVCDPANLGTLGAPGQYMKPEADVQAMGLPEKHVVLPASAPDDFVLFCPHKSTRPLKKLVACTKAYWIGDAEAPVLKGRGKDEVWAQLEGETELVWGFVKKKYLQDAPCTPPSASTQQPSPPPDRPGPTLAPPAGTVNPAPADTPATPAVVKPDVGTGKTMRVNAPDDPGWAKVDPMYLWFKFGEPFFLPHFLKVKVVAQFQYNQDIFWVTVEEGRYKDKDVMINRDNLQDDPGTSGFADTRYDLATDQFYYAGVGPFEVASAPGKAPSIGVHKLRVPDFPHDKATKYGPYATSWFLVGDTDDKYLHPGFVSLGCVTVRIKTDDVTTWPQIWQYLIDARQEDGVVGKIEVVNSLQSTDQTPLPPDPTIHDPSPLGGNVTGGPGQHVWHPPGTTQGGVPIE